MSVSFPSSEFAYSGSRYNFVAALYADYDTENGYVLNSQQINQFFYANSLNNLVLEGQLEYADLEGKVANYLHATFLNLVVGFARLEEAVDGSIATKQINPKFEIRCSFLVDKVEITGREENAIAYRFYLVSDNWLKCAQTLDFSNYDSEVSSIFSLINACIQQNGLQTEISSFEDSADNVKIHYITNGNDNLFTATSYLLNRLCYTEQRDKSLKFIAYDEQAEKYRLFDLAKTDTTNTGTNAIVLAMDKSAIEHIAYEEQNRLATVVSFPKTKLIQTIYNYNVATYDQGTNEISNFSIKSDELVDYYNNIKKNNEDKQPKLSKLSVVEKTAKNFIRNQTVWNNNMHIYSSLTADVASDNALIVNTVGDILRKPSDIVFIDFPQDLSKVKSESQDEYDDFNIRYKQLIGSWITAKVVHIVSPSKKTYRQNLVLFKNYTEKLKDFTIEEAKK